MLGCVLPHLVEDARMQRVLRWEVQIIHAVVRLDSNRIQHPLPIAINVWINAVCMAWWIWIHDH